MRFWQHKKHRKADPQGTPIGPCPFGFCFFGTGEYVQRKGSVLVAIGEPVLAVALPTIVHVEVATCNAQLE